MADPSAVWYGNDSTIPITDDNAQCVDLYNAVQNNLVQPIVCYINADDSLGIDSLGAHISSIFVVLVLSTVVTLFPVLATKQTKVKIPLYVYLFARYFGAGVIIATAFIHLLDPAYAEIGPASCVGLANGWNTYSWPPAIALISSMLIFLLDFIAERYVEKKYGLKHGHSETVDVSGGQRGSVDAGMMAYEIDRRKSTHQHLHSGDQDEISPERETKPAVESGSATEATSLDEKAAADATERSFRQQFAAFLILEFGVLFHSVIIGLTLGSTGPDEFSTLYVVIVFHQAFEGLGIGARLSAIPFPHRYRWLPYVLCIAYGLTTPIAIAIGVGLSNVYDPASFTANVVAGILDSLSAGILLYTGFVELLARDFLFNPDRTDDDKQLGFMLGSLFLGAGIMALLGKWA